MVIFRKINYQKLF